MTRLPIARLSLMLLPVTAMKDFAKTNPTWTDELFRTSIENPRKVVPGTRMAFAGLLTSCPLPHPGERAG